jgi:hypothetical protein
MNNDGKAGIRNRDLVGAVGIRDRMMHPDGGMGAWREHAQGVRLEVPGGKI